VNGIGEKGTDVGMEWEVGRGSLAASRKWERIVILAVEGE